MRSFTRVLISLTLAVAIQSAEVVFADSKSLEDRLVDLEQQVGILKRQLELKKEDEDKAKKETPVITASSKDGFSIK